MSAAGGWPAGYARVWHASLPGTNAEAARRAAAGERGPLWIGAAEQTAGRGRGGRGWSTPPGNLAATLLMPTPPGAPGRVATLAFVAGLAVADMVEEAAGLQAQLKWPNDALVAGRKLAGVLVESQGTGTVAVGMGLNLLRVPGAAGGLPVTSVQEETGIVLEPEVALDALARHWDRWRARWDAGFATLRAAWMARAAFLGETIDARLPGTTLRGRFAGIDLDGALRLQQETGVRRIAAADVFPVEGLG